MPEKRRPATPAAKMQECRRLKEQGLRPVQIWVPDSDAPAFRRDLRMQVARLDAVDEAAALAFVVGLGQ